MVSYIRLKREVIQHELGHWVTARHHETYTDHIDISREGKTYYGHCNLFIFPKLHEIEDAKKLIESRIRTLMAGAAAQLIERKSADWNCVMEIFHSNGSDDFAKINEYISFVSGFDSSTFMDKENTSEIYSNLFERYWTETVAIIEDNAEAIRNLRDYILSKLDNNLNTIIFPTEELVSQLAKNLTSPRVDL